MEIKAWKRVRHENTNQKKAGVSIYATINIKALRQEAFLEIKNNIS